MTTLAPKSILKKSGAAPAAVKKSLSFNDNVAVIGESTNIALLPPAPMKEPDAKSGSYRMGTMRIKGPAVLNGAKPAINDLYGGGGATSTELKEQQQKSVPYGATKQAKIAEPDPIVREGTILEGGLKVLKETGVKGTWVKRHVVLTRTELSYYKDAFTVQPIKTYSISSDCYVKEISKRQGVLDCSNSLEVFFPKNGVVLKGASQREATEWITAICSVIDSLGGNSGSDDDMIFIEEGVDDFDEFVETPEPPKSLYSFSAAPTPVAVTVSAPVTPVVSITPAPAPVVPVAAAPVTPVAVTPAAPAPVTPVVSVTPAPSPVVPVAAAPVTPVAVTPVAASTAKTEHVTIVKTPAAASSSKTTPAPAPSNDDDDEFEWYDEDEEPVKTTFHAVTHSPAPKHHHEPAATPVSATKSAPSSLGTNVTSKTLHPTTPAPAPAPTPVATSTPAPTPAATTAPTRSGTVTATKTQPRATGFYTGVPRTNTVSTPANRTTASGPGRTASTGASQPAPAPAPAATATTPAAAKTPAATATKSTPYGRPPVTSTIAPSGVNTGKVSGLLKMWEQNK